MSGLFFASVMMGIRSGKSEAGLKRVGNKGPDLGPTRFMWAKALRNTHYYADAVPVLKKTGFVRDTMVNGFFDPMAFVKNSDRCGGFGRKNRIVHRQSAASPPFSFAAGNAT
jgi:hypothetical protein